LLRELRPPRVKRLKKNAITAGPSPGRRSARNAAAEAAVARSLYHLTFSSDIKLFDNPAAMPLFSCREKLRRLLKQEGFCSGSVAVCYAVGSLFPEEALALQVGDLRGKFRKECQTGGNPNMESSKDRG
jgi:hypothetical protein